MRIGLYGGSFDPIHRGHVEPVLEAVAAFDLDRVIYLPTAEPPHKQPRTASAHRRLAMVELALLEYDKLLVSGFELTPGRTSFTVDSVRHFAARHAGAELFLLIGSDSFLEFTGWRLWREIAEIATLIVLARPGWIAQEHGQLGEDLEMIVADGRVLFLENRPVPFASRTLRSAIAGGEEIPDRALAPLVLDYLRKYNLYR